MSNSSDTKEKELVGDFEDVLSYIGGWGRYQKTLFLLCFPFTLYLSYVCYSPILVNYTPEHWCAPDPAVADALTDAEWDERAVADFTVPSLSDDEGAGGRSKCLMYNIDLKQVGSLL